MHPRENRIYVVPDGRFVIAQRETFANMTEPAWTLVPYRQGQAKASRSFTDQWLFLENGKLYWLDFSNIADYPIPIVRDSGWTWNDVIDTGGDVPADRQGPRARQQGTP